MSEDSLYSPRVKSLAQREGITLLQAYYRDKAERQHNRAGPVKHLDRRKL